MRRETWMVASALLSLCLFLVVAPARAQEPPTPTPTPTTVPFLSPPFAGGYRITSYVDHKTPGRIWDDTIVVFSGEHAHAINGLLGRTASFLGGYWQPDSEWWVYYDGHGGVDYGTPRGVTVLAAAPGEVVWARSIPSSCATPLQYVALEHANGYRTYYLHLDGICVSEGEHVEAGDPLGISGNSGCSTGPHLHFGVEREGRATDPYGWQPKDQPDPLLAYSGETATRLWAADAPPMLPPESTLLGALVEPPPDAHTNGVLALVFEPDESCDPLARVEFWAYYAYPGQESAGRRPWIYLGADDDGGDGWTLDWDTRQAPEGESWLHAWAVAEDGRIGKGSPIRADVTVDRHPPQGYIVGLEPGSVAGATLWLYAASHDPESTTEQVTFLARAHQAAGDDAPGEWHEIGDASWLHTSNWLLEWDSTAAPPELASAARLDIVARLTDGAGNSTLTQPVDGIAVDRDFPAGQIVSPTSGAPLTTTVELVYVADALSRGALPSDKASDGVSKVAFFVWHDGDWHPAGTDRDGSDGWAVRWDPAPVDDQARLRVQARVYDKRRRLNTALPQVTDLTLDRTPPSVGYLRPRTGGVARPGVAQRVWAWDEGSGVERVEFFVDQGPGWLLIGEDDDAAEGWSVNWDGAGVADGIVDFGARATDRAGNEAWAPAQLGVALDREPPRGAFAYPARAEAAPLSGTITLTLEVTDTVSGLDRAVFYARSGGDPSPSWHHLGLDEESEDGLSLAWDSAPLAGSEPLTLTAWVYDRAGNHVELAHVGGLVVVPEILPTLAVPLSTAVASPPAPTASLLAPTASAPAAAPTATSPPSVAPEASSTPPPLTVVERTDTPPPAAPVALATSTATQASKPPGTLDSTATWAILVVGALSALALVAIAARRLGSGSRS